ncbi:CRISPR-associated protein Cas5 [Caloranaerobacter azorensis H53214]|uniref:CRISPR-associated protein, Cas5h family n=2 Tax=Caloranaerobacter azorensis TaxID=116090 RepID=A0A1M5UH21_9FIRM|nr:type I-B CRISPR-associated protein Cas5b [Caloranaerobacter azorensis]KGG80603.1 CRISPR-associated protein Cas5 [Caloranaerobacter azorensis H53214]SHH62345.1 CRISPR-associated protein, Cas5h family [Caloranaerobacter azorensis DSM 13643]
MKVLVFDVWGDYGHFRKYFTTSSPLTFSFPPKTAIYGLVSAILGIDKSEYLKYFQNKSCKVAIKIINPIKKTRIPINYIDTKQAIDMSKIKNRTQVNLEVIKDCKFRIYFYHKNNELYRNLKELLIDKKCIYSICLGLSELIANYKFIGEFEAERFENKEFVEIDTLIPFDESISIKIQDGREYLKDTVYNEMNEKREITEYISVLYERTGKTIMCNIPVYYKLESGDRIVFI